MYILETDPYDTKDSDKDKESGYHFQEPDISIIGDKFQPISRKIMGFPNRDKKVEEVMNMEFTELWKNLKNIRDNFDKFISAEGNTQDAIYKLNNKLKTVHLFQTPNIDIGVMSKAIGLSIFADNFKVNDEDNLCFDLNVSIKKGKHPVSTKTLCDYMPDEIEIYYVGDLDKMSIKETPCNEPLVTEYISTIFYKYKQLLKFKLYDYECKQGSKEIKKNININIKKNNKDTYLNTLDIHLRSHYHNLEIDTTTNRYYISEESYFTLGISGSNLGISFYNVPFELAEHWYIMIMRVILNDIEKIIDSKYDLLTNIEEIKGELIEVLDKGNSSLAERKDIINKIIEEFQKYKNTGESIESNIYIDFLKDILEDPSYLNSKCFVNLTRGGTEKFRIIIEYYIFILYEGIRENGNLIFEQINTSKKEQDNYITYILDLLEKIKITNPKIGGFKKFLYSFIELERNDIRNFENYLFVGKSIIKWLEGKSYEEFDGLPYRFIKTIVKTKDMPTLFNLIKDGKGINIGFHISKCIEQYKSFFPEETVELIEQILWQYSFMTTVFYQKKMIDRYEFHQLDWSLFDQFADKDLGPYNLGHESIREYENGYEISGDEYHLYMLDNLEGILNGKTKINLRSSDKETLRKKIVRSYYYTFKDIYIDKDIDEKYTDMFMEYFSTRQKNEIVKKTLNNKFNELMFLNEDNKDIPFEIYDNIFEKMKEYYSTKEIMNYRKILQKFLINNVMKQHLKHIKHKNSALLDKNQLEKIFSYLEKEQIRKFEKNERRNKLEAWIEQDIENLKSSSHNKIDINRYKGYDISFSRYLMIEMLELKGKNDKKYIVENKKQDIEIEPILEWYDVLKEIFPELSKETEKIQNNLSEIFKKGTGKGLIESFGEIKNVSIGSLNYSKEIEKYITELVSYIDNLYLDIEEIPNEEISILKQSIEIIFPYIFECKNTKKVLNFLMKLNISKNNKLLLDNINEFYRLRQLFPNEDVKYIQILIGITTNIVNIKKQGKEVNKNKETILHTIITHLISSIDSLEKKDKLSYKQVKDIITRIKEGKIDEAIKNLGKFENSRFVMMFDYF